MKTPCSELQDQVVRVTALHSPVKRWQVHPDDEFSWDTEQEARDEIDGEGDPTFFEVCEHCAEIEQRHAPRGADFHYSIWPCDTATALGGAA